MAWTSPKTWSSEPLTSIDLNTYVRDNQNHLKDRLDNSAAKVISGSSRLRTTSAQFADVDADKLTLSLTTHGGDVLLGFTGTVRNSQNNGYADFNIAVDGNDYIAGDGVLRHQINASNATARLKPISFVLLISGLSAGAHTFKLRWKVSSGNTAEMDVVNLHPQFWAKEI